MFSLFFGKKNKLKENMKHFNFFDIFDKDISPMFICDTNGVFIKANNAAFKLYGYNSKELDNNAFEKRESISSLKAKRKAIMEDGKDIFEIIDIKKDNSKIKIKIRAYMIDVDNCDFILSVIESVGEGEKENNSFNSIFDDESVILKVTETANAIIELRDPYTAAHQKRVANLTCSIAKEMNLSSDQSFKLHVSAILHDIGKLYVPIEILTKSGRLDNYEYSLIKNHSEMGYNILNKIGIPDDICNIVLQHHERMNGSGYPLGLNSKDIYLESKILGVADVVDAMMSHRPYRPKLGIDKTIEEISSRRNVLYDPNVVDVCINIITTQDFDIEGFINLTHLSNVG